MYSIVNQLYGLLFLLYLIEIAAMNKKMTLLLLLFSLAFSSCEDVVSIDTNTSEPKLVVDASILWHKGFNGESQIIRLTTSTAFYDETVPMASGATVSISNSSGETFVFKEGNKYPGVYICSSFNPELWENYTLTIKYKGEIYTAMETMYPVPDLLYTTQEIGGLSGTSPIIKAFFKDSGDEENFYMHRFSREEKRPQSAVFDDVFVNGNETFTVRFYDELPQGEEINIELMGISKRYYNYMMKVYSTVSETNVGPFEVSPAELNGNVVNQTNPDNTAYGYFRLSEVSQITHTAE